MALHFEVHPVDPQPRLLKQSAQILQAGGIAAIPTDSSYALVCRLDDKAAAERLRSIRAVDAKHLFTLLCRDRAGYLSLSQLLTRAWMEGHRVDGVVARPAWLSANASRIPIG